MPGTHSLLDGDEFKVNVPPLPLATNQQQPPPVDQSQQQQQPSQATTAATWPRSAAAPKFILDASQWLHAKLGGSATSTNHLLFRRRANLPKSNNNPNRHAQACFHHWRMQLRKWWETQVH
jgi:hypothetical protein